MAVFYDAIDEKISAFIEKQKIFFVATAASDGRVNLSPKGYQSFRVLGPNRVVWLNLSGSGNETAAHLLAVNRMTLMFCSFEGPPNILRLYGTATAVHPRDESWSELLTNFNEVVGARQVFDMKVESVQTSCGYGVPLFSYESDRDTLLKSAEKKGPVRLQEGWVTKNRISIDGLDTGIVGSAE
jgi:hypothetical protein